MERSTTTGHGGIDREYRAGERRQNVPAQPPAENGGLRRVTTRKHRHALLQLQDGDHVEKETRGGDASRPRQHSLIDPGGFRPAQLGDDVGVERQTFQGKVCGITEDAIHEHADVGIAVIRVKGPALAPLQGAMFQAPGVARTVYTLGYPKLPRLRDASG